MNLNQDYAYCEEIIKQNSKSFYKAYSTLPPEKSRAIYGIYAFCRISDDIIDEAKDLEGLKRLKFELDCFRAGKPVDSPVWRVLEDIFKNYEMDIAPFYDMLEGQFLDSDFKALETDEQLDNYCYLVAGTVGLMILPIIASKNHRELKPTAIALGKAMQLTNILRDIGEDYRKGRIYIPREVMNQYQYSEADLNAGVIDHRFIGIWEHYAQAAEALYDRVKADYGLFDQDSIKSVRLSAEYYREILKEVRKNKYDCLNKRAYVSDFKKIELVLREKMR